MVCRLTIYRQQWRLTQDQCHRCGKAITPEQYPWCDTCRQDRARSKNNPLRCSRCYRPLDELSVLLHHRRCADCLEKRKREWEKEKEKEREKEREESYGENNSV